MLYTRNYFCNWKRTQSDRGCLVGTEIVNSIEWIFHSSNECFAVSQGSPLPREFDLASWGEPDPQPGEEEIFLSFKLFRMPWDKFLGMACESFDLLPDHMSFRTWSDSSFKDSWVSVLVSILGLYTWQSARFHVLGPILSYPFSTLPPFTEARLFGRQLAF